MAEQISPPGFEAHVLLRSQAPVGSDRSLLVDSPHDPRLITPVDALTGIPLCIVPNRPLRDDDPSKNNEHHLWHPASAPELNSTTLAGAALRNSRLQLVEATLHNIRDSKTNMPTYHDYYLGPPLPQTEEGIFKVVVLQCAGYIPRKAIELSSGEPRTVVMTSRQRELLRMPSRRKTITRKDEARREAKAGNAYDDLINPGIDRETYIDQYMHRYKRRRMQGVGYTLRHLSFGEFAVRVFLQDYILRQDIRRYDPIELEEFLDPRTNNPRRLFLGFKLLEFAAEGATESVAGLYSELHKAGEMHPRVPDQAMRLVRQRLGNLKEQVRVVGVMEDSLRGQLGVAA